MIIEKLCFEGRAEEWKAFKQEPEKRKELVKDENGLYPCPFCGEPGPLRGTNRPDNPAEKPKEFVECWWNKCEAYMQAESWEELRIKWNRRV
jgi:hypothetical protein